VLTSLVTAVNSSGAEARMFRRSTPSPRTPRRARPFRTRACTCAPIGLTMPARSIGRARSHLCCRGVCVLPRSRWLARPNLPSDREGPPVLPVACPAWRRLRGDAGACFADDAVVGCSYSRIERERPSICGLRRAKARQSGSFGGGIGRPSAAWPSRTRARRSPVRCPPRPRGPPAAPPTFPPRRWRRAR
jgi:hypothetical protein